MARGSTSGCAVARYLAVSEHTVEAHEMLSLGLLTHLVDDYAYDTLGHSIAHTLNDT